MRIFTYKDPCNLWNSTDGLKNEIKGAPHFCVSEVLVQGLIAKYKREEFNCIATIDEFVKNLFPSWLLETSKDVDRFLEVSQIINKELEGENDSLTPEEQKILKSFQKNIGSIVEVIKYLWETEEIKDNTITGLTPSTLAEKVFINKIVKRILDKDYSYWHPEWHQGISALNVADAIRKCTLDEIRKIYVREEKIEEEGNLEEKRENALAWLRKELQDPKKANEEKREIYKSVQDNNREHNNKIVFHGLYRMKPIHFKLFELLEDESVGYEVIILNCYNPEYPSIYEVWNKLYYMLSQKYKITEVRIGKYTNQIQDNHKIGKIYGNLIEGRDTGDVLGIEGEDKCEFYEYSTTMEFINNVSCVFDETQDEEGKKHIGRMKEQFYGVNGIELNKIFRIFYPELFKKKSFMSFPLGQFIYYLHDMWKDGELKLNHNGLVECLNMYDQSAIKVYNQVETYIGLDRQKNGISLPKVMEKVDKLKECAKAYKKKGDNEFKDVAHFGYILEEEDYIILENALQALQRVAESIFGSGVANAGKHYKQLVDMIEHLKKEPGWRAFEKEEKKLLAEIRTHLENVDMNIPNEEITTDVNVLKDTINFYLRGSTEKDELNWLVRDFEQIDGDLLLFHASDIKKKSKATTVHYGLISNQNMLMKSRSTGIWPLSKETIPNKWIVEMLDMLAENDKAYKRCMLFQGLFYIPKHIKVKMSYVKNVANLNNEEKNHDEYFMMKSIRQIYQGNRLTKAVDSLHIGTDLVSKNTYELRNDVQEPNTSIKILSSCPYRYMFSTALNKETYTYNDNTFLITKFFEEYIKYRMKWEEKSEVDWKKEGKRILGDICTDKEIMDIIVKGYADRYNSFKLLNIDMPIYWVKKVREQIKPETYPPNDTEPWKRRVPIEKLNHSIQMLLSEEWDGFKQNNGNYMISEYICEYCSQKNVCLYPYRLDAIHLLRKKEYQ